MTIKFNGIEKDLFQLSSKRLATGGALKKKRTKVSFSLGLTLILALLFRAPNKNETVDK
jgi:hypothetical protein